MSILLDLAHPVTWQEHVGKWLYNFSPAFASLVVGSVLIQVFFVRRANAAGFVDSTIKEIEALKADALEYWNLDETDAKCLVLEQKIKGSLRVISGDISHLCKKYFTGWGARDDLDDRWITLSNRITGGTFETSTRTKDPAKYLAIVIAANGLKTTLLCTKL